MTQYSSIFTLLILMISTSGMCQNTEKLKPISGDKNLTLTVLWSSLSLNYTIYPQESNTKAYNKINLNAKAAFTSVDSRNIYARKKEPLSPLWNFAGNPVDFGNKFKNALHGVANGKFFNVEANQMGSQWVNQDAIEAHRNNGYRN